MADGVLLELLDGEGLCVCDSVSGSTASDASVATVAAMPHHFTPRWPADDSFMTQ